MTTTQITPATIARLAALAGADIIETEEAMRDGGQTADADDIRSARSLGEIADVYDVNESFLAAWALMPELDADFGNLLPLFEQASRLVDAALAASGLPGLYEL